VADGECDRVGEGVIDHVGDGEGDILREPVGVLGRDGECDGVLERRGDCVWEGVCDGVRNAVHPGVRRSAHDCVVADATQPLTVASLGRAPENQQPTIKNGSFDERTKAPEFHAKIESRRSMYGPDRRPDVAVFL
jgi:hypothetical protein